MEHLFDPLLKFDLGVFEWVQTLQGTFFDKIMVLITTLGENGLIFILLGLALLCTKKYRKVGFAVICALAVMVVGNNLILKEIFARPRPFNLTYDWWTEVYRYPELVPRPDSFSFPSGHTSSAFAAAFAALFYNKKIGAPTLIFAAVMGFTRIFVEVHYCSDVIAGVLAGILYALIAAVIVKYLYPTFERIFEKTLNTIKGKVKK